MSVQQEQSAFPREVLSGTVRVYRVCLCGMRLHNESTCVAL